jgi:hypothetical protein
VQQDLDDWEGAHTRNSRVTRDFSCVQLLLVLTIDALASMAATFHNLTLMHSAGSYQKSAQIMTYILAAVTVIVLLLTLLMIRRIKIAIACLKVAASAIGTMPSIMFFPILTFASFLGLFIYWIYVFAFQWSAGTVAPFTRDPTPTEEYTLSWMFANAAGSNSSAADLTGAGLQPAPVVSTNTSALPCYEDPDCRYIVEFSKEQQVRLINLPRQLAAMSLLFGSYHSDVVLHAFFSLLRASPHYFGDPTPLL